MPLSFALFLVGVYRVVSHYYESPVAHVSTLLLATSPLMLLLSASFMSHIPLLMWMTLCWAFLLGCWTSPQPSWRIWLAAIASGLCGGMAVLTRPQDAVLFGIVIAFFTLFPLLRCKELFMKVGLGLVVGGVIPLLFLLAWNHHLYGQVWATGYNFSDGGRLSQTPIIHDSIGFSATFTWTRALAQSFWVGLRLNQALLGWPSALLFLFPALVLRSVRKTNAVLLIVAGWLYLPYFFFHYYGFELEARYAASSAPFLVVIIARTIVSCFRQNPFSNCRNILIAGLSSFYLYAMAYYWPTYLYPRYAHSYEETSPNIHRLAQGAKLDLPAIILIPNDGFIYSSGFIYNDPQLTSPILYARDLPGDFSCLTASFPQRQFYRYLPDSKNPFCGRFLPIASPKENVSILHHPKQKF